METRKPAVAGMFYPAQPDVLRRKVHRYLDEAAGAGPRPKAIIVPHAGYDYSGPVAASAYARLAPLRGTVKRVVLLGPSHRVWFDGLALPSVDAFETPLGPVPVDPEAVQTLLARPGVSRLDRAHADEHSLEVQLPFLQEVLGEFNVVPLVVGEADAAEVGAVLEAIWGGPETLVVVSSDLSHYLDYGSARHLDQNTARAIETLAPAGIDDAEACGARPINGLLWLARKRALHIEAIDLRSSGDTAGSRDRVVGYGAFVVSEARL